MERSARLGIALASLILLCIVVGGGICLDSESQGFSVDLSDGVSYDCTILSEDQSTIRIDKCRTHQHDVKVPSSIEYNGKQYTVTETGRDAFYGYGVETVELPNTLVKIGYDSFKNSIVKSVSIPDSVVEIGTAAFLGCTELKRINLPKNLEEINNNVFNGCIRLQHIVIPDNVTVINNNAFTGCYTLETVVLPKSLVSMGAAFSGCEQLRSIYIPENLKTVNML